MTAPSELVQRINACDRNVSFYFQSFRDLVLLDTPYT